MLGEDGVGLFDDLRSPKIADTLIQMIGSQQQLAGSLEVSQAV